MSNSKEITATTPPADAKDIQQDPLSLKQPAWHVIVLAVVSLKLYFIYWCYKNWRDLSKDRTPQSELADIAAQLPPPSPPLDGELIAQLENRPQIGFVESLLPEHLSSFKHASPLLRGFFALVPYINNYMLFALSYGIAKLPQKEKSWVTSHPVLSAVAIVLAWISMSYLSVLPGAAAEFLPLLLGAIPLAIVQHWLNKYWDTVESPSLITRHGFTFMELVTIIVGALYLGFLVSGYIMGAIK